MDTPSINLENQASNEKAPGSFTTNPPESSATVYNGEKELKEETQVSGSLEKDANNQTKIAPEMCQAADSSFREISPENDNIVKTEEKMEGTSNDTDSTNEVSNCQDTSTQPTDATTPKTIDKKSRARASSESSQTPMANKVAKLTARATRSSQNPDFAAKQRKFLNRVHDPIRSNNSDSENSQGSLAVTKVNKESKPRSAERKTPVLSDSKKKSDKESTPKRPADSDEEGGSLKKRKTREPTKVVGGVDSYCWRCHRDGVVIRCECVPCPRVYHLKCVQLDKPPDHPWMCPECSLVTQAEDTDTRSRAMRMLSLDQLCNLLRFALNRMKNHEGAEDFSKPVDLVQFPQYRDYIVKPMDLSQLERNIKARLYGSTEAFLADAKWIVHNSIIFNSVQSKFTNTARALLKLCRQEMQHIENCPDCYQNSHTRSSDSWFTEACRRPHILVWAKLKGFPFWPAKVMSVNADNNQVDVRFFGAHDRAWIPLNQCYLYSKLSPTPLSNNKNKRSLEECLQELEYHIKRLRDKFGQFEHAPYKTPYDPKNEDAQLLMMLPQYESKIVGKRSRLSLHHDGARKSLGRRTTSPKHLSSEEQVSEESMTNSSSLNGVSGVGSPSKMADQPMVFIPGKSKSSVGSTSTLKSFNRSTPLRQGESEVNRTPPSKQNGIPVMKKKTPLTAAAKKCFATDKFCAKCQSRTTTTTSEESLCSICSKLDNEPEIHFRKDERSSSDHNSTVRGTVTVQRKRAVTAEADQPGEDRTGSADSHVENLPNIGQSEVDQRTAESEVTAGAKGTSASQVGEGNSSPKYVIHKGLDSDSSEPTKKISIVDRLQEKLCFTVIEALKDQMTPEEVQAIEQEKEIESSPEKVANDSPVSQETSSAVVVLHDLRNNKEMMEKLRESEANKTVEKKKDDSERNKDDVETHSPSEGGSEVETDASSCGDSDSVVAESRKRKKKNINNVVQNLKERKSSVDETSDSKKDSTKESNTVMLDDSVDESPILIIDEGESSDSKKSSGGKGDKSRRKGIPAKVHSRSSTSTESSEAENRLTKTSSVEVLDETSGHFRRSSFENDRPVTITLVTDDEKPQKKAGQEGRSVNISKSLSLSVIKDHGELDMDCAGSDADDQMGSVRKVPPRPTARKTLPNPPRPPLLANLDKRPASEPPAGCQVPLPASQQPPPLVSLRQNAKQWGSSKTPPSPAPAPRSLLKPSLRAEVGPAHAKLEEVVQKVVTFVRSTFEEMLKVSAEVNGENVEAIRQAHQLEMERLRWQHKQEMAELKHNTDLVVMEIRASMEADKQRSLLDLKHKVEIEKEQAILDTKRKQWCAFCQKEAQLYCCWNTAYCSYTCQQEHWMPHMSNCLNKQQSPDESAPPHRSAGVPAYPQVGYNS